ncbi:MAG: DUF3332 domain-containing protein [Candidatus Omnitrophica bacterium]|nr:DUF3332 domain-containing protein [Candidatus Omnitrophota bacterium]
MMRRIQKFILIPLLLGVLFTSLSNCFGKFSLVRKVYQFNDSINVGSGLLTRFVKTLVFYVLNFIPVYGIAGLVDVVILNLIEFWTGSNPLALGEFDEKGMLARTLETEQGRVVFIYHNYGEKLELISHLNGKMETFWFLKNQAGKVYQIQNNKLMEVQIHTKQIGNQKLIQAIMNGKVKSNHIVDDIEYKKLEEKVLNHI